MTSFCKMALLPEKQIGLMRWRRLVHWFSLSALSRRIKSQSTQIGRIHEAERIMQNALTLYAQLRSQNVSFDPSTGPDHIREWQRSLQEFRSLTGIS